MKLGQLLFILFFITGVLLLGLYITINSNVSLKESKMLEIENESIEIYYSIPPERIPVIAVCFHGFMELPTFFEPISNVLARYGISTYAPIMMGVGRTSLKLYADLRKSTNWEELLPMTLNKYLPVFNKTVNKLKEESGAKYVILLGSGMGGGITLLLNTIRNDVIASIIWNPSGFNETIIQKLRGKIRNFLYLLGEFDDKKYWDISKRILEGLGIENPEVGVRYGDFEHQNAKMIYLVPLTGSVMIYFSLGTLEQISYWVSHVLDMDEIPVGLAFISAIMGGLSISLITLSMFAFPYVMSGKIGVFSGGKRWPSPEMQSKALRMAIIWSASILILAFLIASGILIVLSLTAKYNLYIAEIPIYPLALVSWSLSTWILTAYYLSKFLRISRWKAYRIALVEYYSETKNYLLVLIALIIYYPLLIIWSKYALLDLTMPNLWLFILFLATLPLHLWATLLYELLFRRVIQESFGGSTLSAAVKTVILSVSIRMIIPFGLALLWLLIGRFQLFPMLLFAFLFLVEVVIELIAASFYLSTREVVPATIFNTLIWFYMAYIISERLLLILPI